jgi:hypothetical protein
MADAPSPAGEPGATGCFAGLLIGVLTVLLLDGALYLVDGKSIDIAEEWPFILLHMMFAAAPFVLLAGVGVTARLPWLVGLCLTALFWGYLFLDAAWIHRGEGANIGLGLLLPAFPIVIATAALATAKATGSLPDR